MAAGYEVGREVWIPCDVAHGALPLERFVRVGSHWAGMVSLLRLWNTTTIVGSNQVKVQVIGVGDTGVRFRMTGHPVAAQYGWEFTLPYSDVSVKAQPV